MINIPVNFPDANTPNFMPSSNQENDWAAQFVQFQQTLTAAVNHALAGSGGGISAWTDWADIDLLNGVGTLQYRFNDDGDVQLRGAVDFIGYAGSTPLAVALIPEDHRPPRPPPTSVDPVGTFWPLSDFNNDETGGALIVYADSKLYINTPSADPSLNFQGIFYNTASF